MKEPTLDDVITLAENLDDWRYNRVFSSDKRNNDYVCIFGKQPQLEINVESIYKGFAYIAVKQTSASPINIFYYAKIDVLRQEISTKYFDQGRKVTSENVYATYQKIIGLINRIQAKLSTYSNRQTEKVFLEEIAAAKKLEE